MNESSIVYCSPSHEKYIFSVKRLLVPRCAASTSVARCSLAGAIAAEPRGDARATTGLCAFGVLRTKVLREKVHCRSLSSIHMDYNQPLVGGPSVHPTPARAIDNVSVHGG